MSETAAIMSETTAVIVSIVGSAVTVVGVTIATGRILITSISRELGATNKRIDDLKSELNNRIDDTNTQIRSLNNRVDETNKQISDFKTETYRRFEALTSEMHQGFEQVNRELGGEPGAHGEARRLARRVSGRSSGSRRRLNNTAAPSTEP